MMEARESNEHIDLMRLIVMQLISAPAPVTKMKGLQQSEINWGFFPLFLSQSRQHLDMYLKGLADRGSAPFPVCVSPPVSLHPLPQHCYHCCFRNFNTWRAAFSAVFRRAEGKKHGVSTQRTFAPNYHAVQLASSIFFFNCRQNDCHDNQRSDV